MPAKCRLADPNNTEIRDDPVLPLRSEAVYPSPEPAALTAFSHAAAAYFPLAVIAAGGHTGPGFGKGLHTRRCPVGEKAGLDLGGGNAVLFQSHLFLEEFYPLHSCAIVVFCQFAALADITKLPQTLFDGQDFFAPVAFPDYPVG